MPNNAIDMVYADNGVLVRVWLNKAAPAGRPSEVRLFLLPEQQAPLTTYLNALVDGTHQPLEPGPRYHVTLLPASNGVVARLNAQPPNLYRLPEDAADLRAWLAALP